MARKHRHNPIVEFPLAAVSRSDRASDALFWMYERFHKADPRGIFLGFDPAAFRRFIKWYDASDRIVDFGSFSMILDRGTGSYHYYPNGFGNGYQTEVTGFLRRYLKPGMTVADVGANRGYFSLRAASLVGSSGKVYSFEPTPETFGRLLRNIERNQFAQIQPYNRALGNRNGETRLFVSPIDDGMNSVFAPLNGAASIVVPLARLDDALPERKVDFLKIDVEGAESEVLEGATGILESNPSIVVIFEYEKFTLHRARKSYDSAISLLGNLGFRIYRILPDGGVGERVASHVGIGKLFCNLLAMR
jgi:FkbM family methyltransferase